MARTPEILSAARAAAFLGIDRDTLRRWVYQGVGPPRTRKGKRYYYVRQVLVEWLRANAPPAVVERAPSRQFDPTAPSRSHIPIGAMHASAQSRR